MTIQAATPYLILTGKVERALDLYERAFGATVSDLKRFGDIDHTCPEASKDRVMHAELQIGAAILMMSDGTVDAPAPTEPGTVRVAVSFDDPDEMKHSFAALAEGGSVVQEIVRAPWGYFGVVRDELGVQWMFNCAA